MPKPRAWVHGTPLNMIRTDHSDELRLMVCRTELEAQYFASFERCGQSFATSALMDREDEGLVVPSIDSSSAFDDDPEAGAYV